MTNHSELINNLIKIPISENDFFINYYYYLSYFNKFLVTFWN